MNTKLIGEELKSLRNRKRLSLENVSNDLGIHYNTLSKYEKDAGSMQLETLYKLLEYYEVNEYIFFKIIREYNHSEEQE